MLVRIRGTYVADHGAAAIIWLTVRASTLNCSLRDIALPVSEALCSGFNALAIAIGILHDVVVDGFIVGKVHLDLLACSGEVDDVSGRELIGNHEHELVLREDLDERRDGGLRLLDALEAEFALCLWDCWDFLGTFWRHRDVVRLQPGNYSNRKWWMILQKEYLL